MKSNLAEQAKKLEKKYKENISDVLGKMASAYAAKALEYVPPGMTSKKQRASGKKIDKKLYKRTYTYLPNAIKNKKNPVLKSDLDYLHKKYFYRLLSNRKLKASHGVQYRSKGNTVFGYYFKTLRALKKWIKIKNRGLLKVLFGANLTSIRQVIPKVIENLMNKSKNLWDPKIVKLNELKYLDNNQTLKISNKFNDTLPDKSFYSIAVRQGQKQAKKVLKKQMKKITEKKEKI